MDRRAGRLAQRLGGPAARQRRHRRAAFLAVALLAVAAVLLLVGGDDDGGFTSDAGAVCEDYGDRIQREYALSFPEGPINDEAAAQYLSRAFADTMDELIVELRHLEPPADVAEVLDALVARLDEVRSTPEDFVLASPLAGIAEQFDEVDLGACGSEFLATPE